jgi:diguanylate cyclase (GGDEF)-like protein/PAS domain S-box-containing protein
VFTIATTDGETTFVSPSVRWVLGYEPDDFMELAGIALVHPDDRATVSDLWTAALTNPDAAARARYRLRHADGSWRWFDVAYHNLLEDPAVGGVATHSHDVHDRELADEALRTNEARLQALMRNADDAIVISDALGRFVWTSPSVKALWGYEPETLLGDTLLDKVHPDDRRELIRRFASMTRDQRSSVRIEARVWHADGHWRWYECIFTNCLEEPAVRGVVANVRDTTDRALVEQALRASEQRLEYQATHDHLTDLPNRTLLLDRLAMALARAGRAGRHVGVLLLDVDNFKVLNDSRGHAAGDQLLVALARRLTGLVRAGDTVARLGGDEFVVLSEDLPDPADAVEQAEILVDAFEEPLRLPADEIYATVSVGVAVARAGSGSPSDLLRDADAAMYEAKSRGRSRVAIFDTSLHATIRDRHDIETALRHAIAADQLVVHYQPIIDLGTDAVTAAEALVRWQHPDRGLLLPGAFIGIAEESGLIGRIGSHVLREACLRASVWQSHRPDGVRVSVNLSARQLDDPGLVTELAAALDVAGLSPELLLVEITETCLMRDAAASAATLARLKALGVRISIDDFGTGYSSFASLRSLPVDQLKIDRSFIDGLGVDERDEAVVAAIVQMGHMLDLEVLAEGVERAEQLEHLRSMGCDAAQGFHLGRPEPATTLEAMLESC